MSQVQVTPQLQRQIRHYIALAIRKRWFIIIPFCIAMVFGIYKAITLPRIYEARTLILVEPQRVPSRYVSSIVDDNLPARLDTIKQQVMSRTSLEEIIDRFNLFSKPEQKDMFLEDKLESLRKRIDINVTRARGGADAFSITFKGSEPKLVRDVANALATYFIDINLRVRETKAIGTSEFLDGQLEEMRQRLVEVEEAMKAYRTENMGELPEQLNSNLRVLDRLQLTYNEKQQSLREARSRMADYEREAEERLKAIEQQASMFQGQQDMFDGLMLEDDFEDVGAASELEQLKQAYEALLSKYTQQHPDVVRLKKTIEKKERELEYQELAKSETSEKEEPEPDDLGISFVNTFEIQKKALQRETAEKRREISEEIGLIERDMAEIQGKIDEYQRRVEAAPKREQELITLKRDYKNIQGSYSSLLDRKIEAEMAVSMERKAKGEQFRILDPATLPQKPISPDLKKLLAICLAGGLGLGAGLIFLIDFFDTSIRSSDDLEAIGIPAMATIPKIYRVRDRTLKGVNWAASFVFAMIGICLFSGFAVMALKGVDETMSVIKRFL